MRNFYFEKLTDHHRNNLTKKKKIKYKNKIHIYYDQATIITLN